MKTTKVTLSAIALLILTGWNTIATAQCISDQDQPLTNGGTSERNLPGYYDGQTFTVGVDGLLCEIDLMMFNTMTGTMTLNIYAGSGIGGPLLTTQVVNVDVPTGQVWQDWTIESPPSVKKDSVYTFQFVPIQGGGLPDPYGVNVQGSDVYPGGYDLTFPQFDLTFRTYVDQTTGLNELRDENMFSVYPNPSSGKFAISSNEKITLIEIYNCFGEKVYSNSAKQQTSTPLDNYSTGSTEINISGLSKGIYFVKIYSGEKVWTDKMLIQ